jgi:hypothetical protein
MTRYRRGVLTVPEEIAALAAGAVAGLATGLATLYVARRWLAREELPLSPAAPSGVVARGPERPVNGASQPRKAEENGDAPGPRGGAAGRRQ